MKKQATSGSCKSQSKAAVTLCSFGLLLFAVVSVAIVGVRVTTNTAFANIHAESNRAAPLATQQGGRDEVRIELTSAGFAPSEVQHAPGTFAIAVENSALSGEYTLRLKAEDGTVLNEFRVQKGSSAWSVTLQTGTYSLTEANHPEWTCRIVIQ